MSLRKAINAKCRECTYDPLDVGTAAQQIAVCIDSDCPLHSVRPITTKRLPISLLEAYNVDLLKLDDRARGLVYPAVNCSGDAQNSPPVTAERELQTASQSDRFDAGLSDA
jgi:hypothetical protein